MNRSFVVLAVVAASSALAWMACGGSDNPTTGGPPDASAGNDGAVGTDSGGLDAGVDAAPVVCNDKNPLKNPYFGDLHAHTSYSFDAYSFDTRNTPFDAYAFAKGQTLTVAGADPSGPGPTTTIERPLDFLALTDHSEWLAITYGCADALDGGAYDPTSPYENASQCLIVRSTNPVDQTRFFTTGALMQTNLCAANPGACPGVVQSAWQSVQAAAAAAYEPCKFTSFVAYEWTHAVAGATLHKNVIFANDHVPAAPLDSFNYKTAPELWTGLDQQCTQANGCEVVTIPHNSNLSQGGAFIVPAGSEAQMVKYQKLVEIFQHKGGSECYFGPDAVAPDPACDFEYLGGITEPNLPQSYVRTGLEDGIQAYQASGAAKVNPLQMGIIGATDDHNGTPGNTREDTWPGHAGRLDDSPAKRIGLARDGGVNGVSYGHNPGGVAVAWAEQNTREAIFAAFQRRETYATSGPRILVRFYQVWGSPTDPCADTGFPAQVVAAGGVPMGGTFAMTPSADAGAAQPRFVAYAWKDKVDLAEIDVIKAWVDSSGQVHEQLVTNPLTAGQPACVTWTDTSFTAAPSFYYVRVLQTPTPRWSVQDCAADPTANPAGCADGGYLNTNIQERAWTSPIWYLP
jgi:hypothetical protein